MTILLFSAPLWGEGEKEEKLSRNNYVVYLTNDTLSEMTGFEGLKVGKVVMVNGFTNAECLSGFLPSRLCHNSKITLIIFVFHSKSKVKSAKSQLRHSLLEQE